MELNTITERMAIRQALQAGQVDEAIDRVNDLNPEVNFEVFEKTHLWKIR